MLLLFLLLEYKEIHLCWGIITPITLLYLYRIFADGWVVATAAAATTVCLTV